MASTTDPDLDDTTESLALKGPEEPQPNQGNDAPDTTRDRQATHDAEETRSPVFRLFDLPPEIRAMILGLACTEKLRITLPGPLPTGIASLMLSVQNFRCKSEVVEAVWENCRIWWDGSLASKTWQRFKKTAIPRIRRLAIIFKLHNETWFNLDSEIRQTLAWMWQRSKRGNRARQSWLLKHLQLYGWMFGSESCRLKYEASKWYFTSSGASLDSLHWSQDHALDRLRKNGIIVDVGCFDLPYVGSMWMLGGGQSAPSWLRAPGKGLRRAKGM